MKYLLLYIRPRSAFRTLLKGDTVFGQFCWSIRRLFSNERLNELLNDYVHGKPFLVISDAFPSGYLPRPSLPNRFLTQHISPSERKEEKKKIWIPIGEFHTPVAGWSNIMVTDEKFEAMNSTRYHNSIDRRTNSTGGDGFDPYDLPQFWYQDGALLNFHIVYDPDRINKDEIQIALQDIGAFGFGQDATIGMGRFDVIECNEQAETKLPKYQTSADAWLTLAPSAPQGLQFDSEHCWYRPFVRFGKHGDLGTRYGNPFKKPIMLADTGAVFTPMGDLTPKLYLGQGIGGADFPVSKSIPETVHQGYAPVAGINLLSNIHSNSRSSQ